MQHSRDLADLAPRLAEAAQTVLDEWQQDEEGNDDALGAGGACQDVAAAMAGVLSEAGIETASIFTEFDGGHVFLMAHLEDGAYAIDIPARAYETGGGDVWTKREGIRLSADDVLVERHEGPMSADEFAWRYLDEAAPADAGFGM